MVVAGNGETVLVVNGAPDQVRSDVVYVEWWIHSPHPEYYLITVRMATATFQAACGAATLAALHPDQVLQLLPWPDDSDLQLRASAVLGV